MLRPGGEVTVSARQRGDRVVMTWDERGAEVAEGEHAEGFGSRLIALSVEAQMRGSIKRTWRNDGLTVEVEVPFSALNQSAALQAHPAS
jgi:two-component sensor histidine kinase